MIVCPWKDLGRYAPVLHGLEEAMQVVAELTDFTPRTVPLSNGNRFFIVAGTTKDAAVQEFEAHRNYLDIQYILKGEETVGWAPLETLTVTQDYNPEKDIAKYTGHADFMRITEGNCYVAFPEDGHMPGVYLDAPHDFVKLVVKLKV